MGNTPTTTIRIESDVKDQATDILNELGLSLSAGINIFLRAVIRTQGIPFDISLADSVGSDSDVRK